MTTDTRTEAERRYDATALSSRPHAAAPEPAAVVQTETYQLEDGTPYTDLAAGAGLTRVVIGSYGDGKAGLELIIGGSQINQYIDEVLTVDDVRELRDNLSALLADPRLLH